MTEPETQSENPAAPALFVRNLRKVYSDVVAVDGIDLDAVGGECFGLLGPNGAGKTTTIEICEGMTEPDSGTVELLGLTWKRNEQELRQRIGIQLQETQLADKLTVRETVVLFRSFYRKGISVDDAIGRVQLEEKRGARVSALSGGQKQRLAVACALVGNPDLLFLDEPTTGLDPQARRQLWDLVESIKSSGRTIILTTHYMDEAERLCDRIAIMDRGRIIARGTPAELISSIGAEQLIEFQIGAGLRPSLDALAAVEGVRTARENAGRYQLYVSELTRSVPALFAWMAAHQTELVDLQTHSATLEDVFVALTGRHLREE